MGNLVEDKVEVLRKRAQREIDEGVLPSCQFALALNGELVAHESFGDAELDTRYVIFSATKPVVASAAWIMIQEGKLDVSKKVADYIDEFATNGKDVITVEQVMLHTSGFPAAPLGPPDWSTREARLKRFGEWKLNWEPGTKFEYHATSAHWVLAELVERLSGQDYRQFIAERVTGPLNIPKLQVGVPLDQQADIATLELRGEPPTPEELQRVLGISAMPVTEVTDNALIGFNAPETREVGVPGGGGVARASDLALFYQGLLHNPEVRSEGRSGPGKIWDDELLADVKTRVRNSFPELLGGYPVQRTLGLCKAGDDGNSHMRGFGRTVSGAAFGHNGAAGQLAWADPASGLSFVYLTNGIDANTIRQGRRGVALNSIAAECATRN